MINHRSSLHLLLPCALGIAGIALGTSCSSAPDPASGTTGSASSSGAFGASASASSSGEGGASAASTSASTAVAGATTSGTGGGAPVDELVAWDGDAVAGGAGWSTPSSNPVTVQSTEAHAGSAVSWQVVPQSVPWSEWGWNWKAWQKPGTTITGKTTFTFYLKIAGNQPPGDLVVSLRSSISDKYAHQPPAPGGLRGVSVKKYAPAFAGGSWQLVSIPLADLLEGESTVDFQEVYEIFLGAAGSDYQLFLDELAFH